MRTNLSRLQKLAPRLLLGLLTFSIGVSVGLQTRHRRAVIDRSSVTTSLHDGSWVTYGKEVYSSPSKAAEQFNSTLSDAPDHKELGPCVDSKGEQITHRAILIPPTPNGTVGNWKLMWTRENVTSSELDYVEAATLREIRAFELKQEENFAYCK